MNNIGIGKEVNGKKCLLKENPVLIVENQFGLNLLIVNLVNRKEKEVQIGKAESLLNELKSGEVKNIEIGERQFLKEIIILVRSVEKPIVG